VRGVALIAHFAGDPDDLTPRFRAAAHRYAMQGDVPMPATALVLRNKDGITVVLGWAEGASLQPFGGFLRDALGELGLPHPHVEHFRADAAGWEEIATPT
jgi:hypothetical protein